MVKKYLFQSCCALERNWTESENLATCHIPQTVKGLFLITLWIGFFCLTIFSYKRLCDCICLLQECNNFVCMFIVRCVVCTLFSCVVTLTVFGPCGPVLDLKKTLGRLNWTTFGFYPCPGCKLLLATFASTFLCCIAKNKFT